VVAETVPGEHRVAAVPETVGKLRAAGLDVRVQSGAGAAAFIPDAAFLDVGAEIVKGRKVLLKDADVVLAVQPFDVSEVAALRAGSSYFGFLPPWAHPALVEALAARKVTAYSLDLVPRISRAQSMDALSSQALVAGYRGALVAAQLLPRFFPMSMTAAGTIPPAKVLVLGAGVAGLQAIATARRLGAVVEAYDVRAAAAEEVRSLGATFLEIGLETQEGAGGYARVQSEDFLARQRELIGDAVVKSDAVVTTAAVPGRRAPLLVTKDMVKRMRPGAVVVDLAADGGGNCELTVAGEEKVYSGVTVVGISNPPSTMPLHASALLARNLATLLLLMVKDGELVPDPDDEIVAGCCVTRDGEIVHPLAREAVEEARK
jgi:NAD(P) transhydrogenase subunit alpha